MATILYSSTFKTQHNREYTIEIRKKNTTGITQYFDLASDGFTLKYDQGSNLRLAELMPSTLTFGFIIKNETERIFVRDVLSAPRGEYYIRVQRTGLTNTYWAGWIEPGFDTYADTAFPYTTDIRATDSLDVVIDKYTNVANIIPTDNFKDLRYPMRVIADKYDFNELFSFRQYNFAIQWKNNASDPDPLVDPSTETFYNRQAFVDNPIDFPNIIRDIYTEFKGVYKAFGCRVFFSEGQYRVIQDNTYNINYKEWIYLDPTSSTPYQINTPNNQIAVNNDLSPTASNNAVALGGGTHTFDPELNSVRANFVFGDAGAVFDPSEDYDTFTTIGILGGGSANMLLSLNLQTQQTHTMPNPAGPFQPLGVVGGVQQNNLQGLASSTLFTCKFKSGSYYLNCNINLNSSDNGSNVSLGNFEWSQDANNEVRVQGTAQNPFCTPIFDYDLPAATTTVKLYFQNVEIPPPPFFGELQFKYSAVITFLDSVPAIPLSASYDDLIIAVALWFNPANPPLTTTQQINTMAQMGGPAMIINPCSLAYAANDTNNQGAIYMAQQTPSVTNPDFNLGDVKLGVVLGESDSIKTLAFDDAGDFVPITGMKNVNFGTYISPTRLLCREYLKGQNKPVNIWQGTIESTNYEAHKYLYFEDYINTVPSKWIFMQGSYNAANEQWNGSWYKLDVNENEVFNESEDINNDPNPPLDPGPIDIGGHGTGSPLPEKIPGKNNLRANSTNVNDAVLSLIKSNELGITTTAIPAAIYSDGDEFDLTGIRCDLKINQKIMLCDDNGGNFTYLETYAAKTAGSPKISIKAKTLSRSYPVGSVLMIQSNDLTNVITGGGGVSQIVAGTDISISPAGGTGVVTINSTGAGSPSAPTNSVQYNNGGNFGGESAFRYFPTSNNLFVTNTNSHFFGTNIGHRSYLDPNTDELWFFLTAQDFDLGDTSRYFIYSRDGSDTIMNGYDSRAPMRIASTYLPIGYRLVAYEVYTNAARPLLLRQSTFDSTNTTLLDTATTNAINALGTPYTINVGDYFTLLVDADRSTTQVLGGRLRLTKV